MRISYIELENFKSYRDKQKIPFAFDDKYITIVEGQMGHGKSNLLNAFYWCIFDLYWDSDEGKLIENPQPGEVFLFNKGELNDRSIDGGRIDLYVKIEFHDDDNNRYVVKRLQGGNYVGSEWKFERNSKLVIHRFDGETGEFEEISSERCESELYRFFPKSLSNYFLFRGENRAQLVKLQGKDEFQSALKELSKIEVFNRSITHLSFCLDKFRKELAEIAEGDLKQKYSDALEKKSDVEKLLEDYKDELKNLEQIEQDTAAEYDRLSNKIKENQKAFEIQVKKEDEEGKREQLRDNYKAFYERRRRHLTKKWGSLIAGDLSDKTLARYQKAVDEGKYPPDISKSLMQKIINELTCICGSKLVEGTQEYDKIMKLQKSVIYDNEHTTEISKLTREIERAKVLAEQLSKEIADFDLDEKSLKDQIKEKNRIIEAYESQIGNLDESLEQLQNKQNDAKDELIHTKESVVNTKNLIKSCEKDLKEVDDLLFKIQQKLDKSQLPAIKVDLTEKALKETKKLKADLEGKIFDDLEKYTQEHWDLLVYDKLYYDKIKFDRQEVYFDVLDRDGRGSRSILNTGHSILLVLSFISALVRIAKEIWKEDFPLVMDAPLSEVGESALPQALVGFGSVFNQTIVILKDGTINTRIKNELKEKIGKHYWIQFDKNRQHTKIEEI